MCDYLIKILGDILCLMVIFVIKATGFIVYGSKDNNPSVPSASYSQRRGSLSLELGCIWLAVGYGLRCGVKGTVARRRTGAPSAQALGLE